MSVLIYVNQKNFHVPSSYLIITSLTITSTELLLFPSNLTQYFPFPPLPFPSPHFSPSYRFPFQLPNYSFLSFMWEIMNSRYITVILDTLRSCYWSHHWAPVIHNNSCVKTLIRIKHSPLYLLQTHDCLASSPPHLLLFPFSLASALYNDIASG